MADAVIARSRWFQIRWQDLAAMAAIGSVIILSGMWFDARLDRMESRLTARLDRMDARMDRLDQDVKAIRQDMNTGLKEIHGRLTRVETLLEQKGK